MASERTQKQIYIYQENFSFFYSSGCCGYKKCDLEYMQINRNLSTSPSCPAKSHKHFYRYFNRTIFATHHIYTHTHKHAHHKQRKR